MAKAIFFFFLIIIRILPSAFQQFFLDWWSILRQEKMYVKKIDVTDTINEVLQRAKTIDNNMKRRTCGPRKNSRLPWQTLLICMIAYYNNGLLVNNWQNFNRQGKRKRTGSTSFVLKNPMPTPLKVFERKPTISAHSLFTFWACQWRYIMDGLSTAYFWKMMLTTSQFDSYPPRTTRRQSLLMRCKDYIDFIAAHLVLNSKPDDYFFLTWVEDKPIDQLSLTFSFLMPSRNKHSSLNTTLEREEKTQENSNDILNTHSTTSWRRWLFLGNFFFLSG